MSLRRFAQRRAPLALLARSAHLSRHPESSRDRGPWGPIQTRVFALGYPRTTLMRTPPQPRRASTHLRHTSRLASIMRRSGPGAGPLGPRATCCPPPEWSGSPRATVLRSRTRFRGGGLPFPDRIMLLRYQTLGGPGLLLGIHNPIARNQRMQGSTQPAGPTFEWAPPGAPHSQPHLHSTHVDRRIGQPWTACQGGS